MYNIGKTIIDYIKAQSVYTTLSMPAIYLDAFADGDSDGLVLRHDPSVAADKEYIDGSKVGICSFSLYARARNALNGRKWIDGCLDCIDEKKITGNGTEVITRAVTTAQYVSVDDKNRTVYMATINASYYQEATGE